MPENRFHEFLLSLYQSVSSQPISEFKNNALRLLQPHLPFDSALWGGGVVEDSIVQKIHYIHLFELPSDFLKNWNSRKEEDGLLKRILTYPGKAFTESEGIREERREDTDLYKLHSQPHKISRAVSVADIEPVTGLFCAISLYRKHVDHPYSSEEIEFFQYLMPHLMQANILNQLFQYRSQTSQSVSQGNGIVDQEGSLHIVDSELIKLFRLEWPHWKGGSIPAPAKEAIGAESRFAGEHIVVDFHPVSDLYLVQCREIGELKKLSLREAEIIPFLVKGKSYKEIGHALHISHSTVNKHVLSIYKKLDVTSKTELSAKCGGM